MDTPLAVAVHNNIVISPVGSFVHANADPSQPWEHVSWDRNIYYPIRDEAEKFYTVLTGNCTFSEYRRMLGWDMNSLTEDPRFAADAPIQPEDFRLQRGSPAIDAGQDVGITRDFAGNAVPWGPAPDIGAHEYTAQDGDQEPNDSPQRPGIPTEFRDFALLAMSWMQDDCSKLNCWCEAADLNKDGFVDHFDLGTFAVHFSVTSGETPDACTPP
jgi:hypothetical protein